MTNLAKRKSSLLSCIVVNFTAIFDIREILSQNLPPASILYRLDRQCYVEQGTPLRCFNLIAESL
jgi:hypothetical protein